MLMFAGVLSAVLQDRIEVLEDIMKEAGMSDEEFQQAFWDSVQRRQQKGGSRGH